MSWEILQRQVRASSTEFRISVKKTGVALWIPKGHRFEQVKSVATMLGRGDDLGKIRITPSEASYARVVYKHQKNGCAQIKYTTLPEAPKELNSTVVQVRDIEGGGIEFRLPWFKVQDFSGRVAAIPVTSAPKPEPAPLKAGPLPTTRAPSIFDKKPAVSSAVKEVSAFALGGR